MSPDRTKHMSTVVKNKEKWYQNLKSLSTIKSYPPNAGLLGRHFVRWPGQLPRAWAERALHRLLPRPDKSQPLHQRFLLQPSGDQRGDYKAVQCWCFCRYWGLQAQAIIGERYIVFKSWYNLNCFFVSYPTLIKRNFSSFDKILSVSFIFLQLYFIDWSNNNLFAFKFYISILK